MTARSADGLATTSRPTTRSTSACPADGSENINDPSQILPAMVRSEGHDDVDRRGFRCSVPRSANDHRAGVMNVLPWSWLRATGEHDDVELTTDEKVAFYAISQRNQDVWS